MLSCFLNACFLDCLNVCVNVDVIVCLYVGVVVCLNVCVLVCVIEAPDTSTSLGSIVEPIQDPSIIRCYRKIDAEFQ